MLGSIDKINVALHETLNDPTFVIYGTRIVFVSFGCL